MEFKIKILPNNEISEQEILNLFCEGGYAIGLGTFREFMEKFEGNAMAVKRLAIDIETYSSNDIKGGGVYKYVEADDFTITLFAYKIDDQQAQVVDLTCERIPDDVWNILIDPKVLKTAYNANFERTCLAKHFNREFPAEEWSCTAVLAAKLGLPGPLKDVAVALDFPKEEQKIDGWRLINYFCIPCKPTKVNGGRTKKSSRA